MIVFICGVVLGNMMGLLVAVIVSGKLDDYSEWRKKRNEQKRKNNF